MTAHSRIVAAPTQGGLRPRVRIVTTVGDMIVELAEDRAPLTVAAFLAQVDRETYGGGAFSRIVRADNDPVSPSIEVIQAFVSPGALTPPGVPLETTKDTGLRHEDGTLSFARASGGDSSAQTFFICVGPQPALDHGGGRIEDGRGFAAFGRLVEGFDVARAIHGGCIAYVSSTQDFAGQTAAAPIIIYRIGREGEDDRDRLRQVSEDYWRFRVQEFPTEATTAGVASGNRRLEGVASTDHARRNDVAGRLLQRAQAIDAKVLNPTDTTTLILLVGQLQSMRDAYALREHERPRLFPFGFADVAVGLVQSTALDSFGERDDFAARLRAMPAFLADSLEAVRSGLDAGFKIPRVLKPRVLALLDSHLCDEEGLRSQISRRLSVDPGVAMSREDADAQRLEIDAVAANEVLPALLAVRHFIAGLDDNGLTDDVAVSSQPDGRAYYRYKVRQQTSLDLEPDDIHETGLREIARIGVELEDMLVAMGRPGERAEVAVELEQRIAPNAKALLAEVRAFAKRVDGVLPRLFGRMPRITYGVEPLTIAASAALPPGLAQPSPADRSMPGVYWLTALPERCPRHLIVPLTLHEAWPGHLMQFAAAHELEDLPDFRRYGWAEYNGYVEGWALYCERLGEDLGLYDDPADRFGLLSFELWRASRLVVDTGLHWKGWSRAAAIDFMVANSFLPLTTIEGEVDRYIGMPAQALSYKTGERVIAGLRAEGQQALAARFSLRAFHDEILSLGPVSLTALQSHMRRWFDGARDDSAPVID